MLLLRDHESLALGLRAGWGAALVLAPADLLRVSGAPNGPADRLIVRVLGARHVAEAILLRRPTAARRTLSASVDLVHGATMVMLAARLHRWRRAAALSAAVSLAFVTLPSRP